MDKQNYNISDEEMAFLAKTLDEMLNEDAPDFYGILKECAWNILHENPGSEFGDWMTMLIEQYPTEVVDALGSNPDDVYPQLSDLWDSNDYEDPDTGMCHSFQVWAEYFATEQSVELYDLYAETKKKYTCTQNVFKEIDKLINNC